MSNAVTDDEAITAKEAAQMIGCSLSTVYRLLKQRILVSKRVGGGSARKYRLIVRASVEKFIRE